MNGIRGKASTSPPVQVSAQQQQRSPYYQQRGDNIPEFQPAGYQPQFSQQQEYFYQQQLGAQSQNYDIKLQSSMLGQNVGQQPPSSMYQQQQGPPQGMRQPNPPFYPGGNPQRQPRFPTGQMNQGTPQQGMYNLPTVMYIPNAGQFGPNQQILVNPGMIQQPRMNTPQYNPGMASSQTGMYQMPQQQPQYMQGYNNPPTYYNTQQQQSQRTPDPIQQPRMNTPQYNPGMGSSQTGMYQMPQQQPQYTQGYNNPPTYYNTQQQQSQRTPSGGAPMNPGKQKERKNRIQIIDPNSMQEVAVDTTAQKSDSGSRSTPSGESEPTPGPSPNNEIAAEFAAEVAKRLYPSMQQQSSQMPPTITSPQPPATSQPPQMMQQPPPNHPNMPHMPGPGMPPNMSQAPPPHGQVPVPMGSQAPGNMQMPPQQPGMMQGNIPGLQMGVPPPVGVTPEGHIGSDKDLDPQSQNGDVTSGAPTHIIMDSSSEVKPNSSATVIVNSNSPSLSNIPDVVPQISAQSAEFVPSAVHEMKSNEDKTQVSQSDMSSQQSSTFDKTTVDSVPGQTVEILHSSDAVKSVTVENTGNVLTDANDAVVDSSVGGETSSRVPVRQSTPEVVVSPATPVEKDAKMDLDKKPEDLDNSSASKKDKSKKKARDRELNKKGDKISASVFDAYTDEAAQKEESIETTQKETESSEKENVEPITNQVEEVVPKEELTPPTSRETTPAEETIQTVEIKIQDVGAEEEDELEEGEIVDDDDDDVNMLKYKYAEDQWSPLNPEGKKHYDREFLLQFQFESAATCKPAGLPDIPDIILDKPLTAGRQYSRELSVGSTGSNDAGSFDFTPKYVWTSGGGGRPSKGLPRQPSNQKKQGGGQIRQINVSISKDIELHKAKEAWKPMVVEKKDVTGDDELYKKTRSILNKLTPQKFQTLVSQMQALPIDSENKLKGVIDLVFEKAISEPNFSVAYANMCRCLSMFKVQSQSKPGEMVNFRAVLLTRCQREFEKDKSAEAGFAEKRKEIEEAEEGPKKEELKAELEYAESKAKRRSLGNIRFIGELFKLKMLTENIMHDCVFKLLRTKDPENLECLCRLLTTIGKELDTDKAKPRMDQYFTQMGKIVNEKKTSSRVRFMLQDVIDLRLNKWVPRRVDNNPKTIDQIHREVEQEAQEKALLTQQAQLQQKANRGRRGPPGPGGQMGGPGSDGWNTVYTGRTPLKSVDRSIDPSKMKFSKQNVDETIQLGPGGGASRFGAWGRGSTGGTTGRPSQEKEKPSPAPNRFSALSKPEDDSSRRYSGVSPARGEGRGRGGFGRPPAIGARHSQESEREKALAAAKAISASQSMDAGRDSSRGREPARRPEEKMPPPPAPAQKELSAEEMEKKTKAILDEYLHILDIKEAMECVKELPVGSHHHFVSNSINLVLERSQVARKQTGHLLHDLVKNGNVAVQAYLTGLNEALEFAEDMEIDIPKIWQYYGELISPMIQDGSVQLNFLKEVCKPLLASNKAGQLLAEILHDASHREGHKKVASIWMESGLQWTDFVPKNQIEQFLIDKKLEFTKGDSAPSTPTTGLPITEISNKLHELIVVKSTDNEAVFDWIETNVDEPTTKTHQFIRTLMTAVCNSAIKGERGKEKVEQKEISSRHDLLQKYLDHQAESELQALYALQALVTKLEHPKGVLRTMFDTFYDEDIISEDAFIQWEKSEEEPEGKGVALKQVVQFFAWLREAEDES